MSSEPALRRGLWAVAALASLGTAAELALLNHTGSPPQLVPFALCFLGVLAAGAGAWGGRQAVLFARVVAVLLVVGSVFGVWEHLEHNYAFAAEIRPTATLPTLLKGAILGASPLLAPGALFLSGSLLALASWKHPSRLPKPA